MPDYLGDDQRKIKEEEKDDGPIRGTLLKRAYNADWGVFIHRNVGISYLANANLLSTYFNYLFFKNTCVSEWNINVHIVRDMENISFNESCRRKYKVLLTLTTMLTTQRQCHRAQPLMMFFIFITALDEGDIALLKTYVSLTSAVFVMFSCMRFDLVQIVVKRVPLLFTLPGSEHLLQTDQTSRGWHPTAAQKDQWAHR